VQSVKARKDTFKTPVSNHLDGEFREENKEKLVMNRITTCTKGMLLACTALAFAFAGCTSDQASTGGIDATLTLDADAVVKHITTVTVTVECDGIDPITGLPWPSETFDVNVNTSEGNDPTDPKDTMGVFKKEGLPEGLCTVTIVAISDDGTMTCGGQQIGIPVVAGPDNTFVTIILSCVTDARYGGIGVTGEFNQCSEYSQIIVSPTTQSTGGDPVDVQIWCYDPDGGIDSPLAAVLFITAASSIDPNPANWINCGSNPAYQFPPTPVPCPHQDPPTIIGNQSADLDLLCNIGDNGSGDPGTPCVVIVSISDDGFAAGGTDPFGCDGTDDNANAVIPVFCQSLAVCGNGTIESPETCDPPGAPNGALAWCDSVCQTFDPCGVVGAPPNNCPPAADPNCAGQTCSEAAGVITCDNPNVTAGVACDLFNPGGPLTDGFCDGSGTCIGCVNNTQCNLIPNPCAVGTCSGGSCTYVDQPTGTNCGTSGQCTSASPSLCTEGACTDETGVCLGGGEPCASGYDCAQGTCSVNGNPCTLDRDCGTCAIAGTPCSADFMCPTFGDSCTASTETCNGADICNVTGSNSAFICGPQGTQIKGILTGCGVCGGGLGACPDDCFGVPQNPANGADACTAGVLLRTPEGLCPQGLDSGCLGCYGLSVACGSAAGPPGGCLGACSNLAAGAIDGPNGCDCIDCITTECDPAFAACAGFGNGAPAGTPNAHPTLVGGPPVCEGVPTPACDN
jgi:hypothetical protein